MFYANLSGADVTAEGGSYLGGSGACSARKKKKNTETWGYGYLGGFDYIKKKTKVMANFD